ncbi:transposase [Legionella gresilensis]|uniref:transposase n=1 Tax=Legionella gresilensis TaxID=91823 RepID=UPI001F5F8F88|nr:transposase [Legionella gresilensis]
MKKLIKNNPTCDVSIINTDKNPAYHQAIRELKQEGSLSKRVKHHQIKYCNNRLEADHGKLKRLINPTLGFQSMKTAYATLTGFEIMRMFKKNNSLGGCTVIEMKYPSSMNRSAFTVEIYLKFNVS